MRLRSRAPRLHILVLVLALTSQSALAAQLGPPGVDVGGSALPGPYQDPLLTVAMLRQRIAVEPDRSDLRLAAARELTALGLLDSTQAVRLDRLRQAEAEARVAVALDASSAEAHYWLAAALGLKADQSGGLGKISAAREAYAQAQATLALDPEHGGGHHIVGRLHAGARRLGRLNRLIARSLGFGEILRQASWESAEDHMRRALAADPDPWAHTVELAKLLIALDQQAEGNALLEGLVSSRPRHRLDAHYLEVARGLYCAPERSVDDSLPGPSVILCSMK